MKPEQQIKLIKIADVMVLTGLSKTTIYEKMREGKFPQNFAINGTRCVVWVEAEIYAWNAEQLLIARTSGPLRLTG